MKRCQCPGCTMPLRLLPAPTGAAREPSVDDRVLAAEQDMRDRYGDDR